LDEPCLALDLTPAERQVVAKTYQEIKRECPHLQIILANYFECYGENLETVLNLPLHTIHLDLVRCPSQLDDILGTNFVLSKTHLSLGVVDGRNICKNDFQHSLSFINKALKVLGSDRIWIAPSCSLIHSPCDLDGETNERSLPAEVKQWLAFAKQKVEEVVTLKPRRGYHRKRQPSRSSLRRA
jgi:5-methyltetrahydropteroyltriglutamate--homocysteine methyltransferase